MKNMVIIYGDKIFLVFWSIFDVLIFENYLWYNLDFFKD